MNVDSARSWQAIHDERERLFGILKGLDAKQWASQSLCSHWNVENVVAHLTAAASTGTLAWLRSIVFAGFSADRHNARRLDAYLCSSPEQTLELYRASLTNTVAPSKDNDAWLGEVVVHGQDISRPLGLDLVPDAGNVARVAHFYASNDFAVNSRTLVKGLSLEAYDADFRVGSGPVLRGSLLDLVMAMAGRPSAYAKLDGDGLAILRTRTS